MSKAAKEKKSLSKRLFRRSSVRSLGSFMSRMLKTLSTLSHFGTEGPPTEGGEKDDGGFTAPKGPGPSTNADCGSLFFGDKVPGVSGLKNHGNTCFMNAILQCLSNTELFAEYMALEQFWGPSAGEGEEEDNRRVTRPRSEVTEQLSSLVRALWTFEYTPQHSREFKNAVSKNALQFRGNAQHDAQEFLLWLLDRVHEDLNNVVLPSNRPSLKPPIEEDDGSLEGPALPLSASSFVQELFQAQYRTSLTCPHCQKQSNTFDPFLCISLPIPLPHTRPIYITVVYQGKCSHCMRIGVAVPLSGTVSRLREAVSMETKIPVEQIVLTEMYYDGFQRSFCDDDDDLEIIQESDSIFAFETPETFRPETIRCQRENLNSNLNQNNLKYAAENIRTGSFMFGAPKPSPNKNSDKILLLVCNRSCTGHQGRRFGHPFVLHVERTVTWDVLQKAVLEKMRHLLRPGVFIQVGPFSLRVVSVVGITYLLPQEEQPLCHPTVDRAYKSCGSGGPPHVKLVVEWDKETKDYLFGRVEEEYIPDAESVRMYREQHQHPQTCSLAQCLQLYTKEEQLAPDDAWRCPHCRQLQQGRIKLSLWTLPDILILHLKRFRQEGDRRVKMQNLVKFPLMGMDMAPHVVKRSQSSWSLPSHWSPWRRPYGLGRAPEDFFYDLYAVCNHQGSMHGGHYTAFCKNSVDGQWYCFDDSDVQAMADEQVCQPTAYILFYQRRTAIPSWSANSSIAGSTSSSLWDHWINRLPGSRQPSVGSGASSRRTSLASLSESVEFTGDRSEDDGGFSFRPFVRSVQRHSSSSRSSIASPLAKSENGIKPSWSLSAKLHIRSSSPSRFSLDSFSSSNLERIGESCDDKVSTSCFGSYSRHQRYSSGKAPLAVMESITSDEGGSKISLDDVYRKAPGNKRTSRTEIGNNNSQAGNQEVVKQGTPAKDPKQCSNANSSKLNCPGAKTSSVKSMPDLQKSLKKRQSTSITTNLSLRQASLSPQTKSSVKVTNLKEQSEPTKSSKSSPSGTPKKASSKSQESLIPFTVASPQKKRSSSTLKSSTSPSSTGKKVSSGSERSLAASRTKLVERCSVQGSTQSSPLSDRAKKGIISASTLLSKNVETSQPNRKLRSSSSSSSVMSLRSPSISVKDLSRTSRSEDKGLSFFKSSLRQKETRISADLGKTALLSKKTYDGTTKTGTLTKSSTLAAISEPTKSLHKSSQEPNLSKPMDKVGSQKTYSPVKRSISSAGKLKSSTLEKSLERPLGRKPAEKTVSSSMQSARPTLNP